MKRITIIVFLLIGTTIFAQNKNAKATVIVDGVCMMCKERIEKASIKTKGVKSAIWNVETHELKLIYDERKTDLKTIQNNVASVGHDSDGVKAPDEAYDKIHDCCKYRDLEVQKEHKKKKIKN